MDLHSKLPSKDSRDILTSSAWNALIHHPVVEEENAEELPSTVDMDAIKGAPNTPLTATAPQWSVEQQNGNAKKTETDGSSSDDEDDSDASSTSGSDTDVRLFKRKKKNCLKFFIGIWKRISILFFIVEL